MHLGSPLTCLSLLTPGLGTLWLTSSGNVGMGWEKMQLSSRCKAPREGCAQEKAGGGGTEQVMGYKIFKKKTKYRFLTMWLPQGRGWPLPSQGPAETDF